jgi:predicted HicB family RNase H-like nuclease
VPKIQEGFLSMTRINIEIPEELHKKARLKAIKENTTLIKLINQALEDKIKKEGKIDLSKV